MPESILRVSPRRLFTNECTMFSYLNIAKTSTIKIFKEDILVESFKINDQKYHTFQLPHGNYTAKLFDGNSKLKATEHFVVDNGIRIGDSTFCGEYLFGDMPFVFLRFKKYMKVYDIENDLYYQISDTSPTEIHKIDNNRLLFITRKDLTCVNYGIFDLRNMAVVDEIVNVDQIYLNVETKRLWTLKDEILKGFDLNIGLCPNAILHQSNKVHIIKRESDYGDRKAITYLDSEENCLVQVSVESGNQLFHFVNASKSALSLSKKYLVTLDVEKNYMSVYPLYANACSKVELQEYFSFPNSNFCYEGEAFKVNKWRYNTKPLEQSLNDMIQDENIEVGELFVESNDDKLYVLGEYSFVSVDDNQINIFGEIKHLKISGYKGFKKKSYYNDNYYLTNSEFKYNVVFTELIHIGEHSELRNSQLYDKTEAYPIYLSEQDTYCLVKNGKIIHVPIPEKEKWLSRPEIIKRHNFKIFEELLICCITTKSKRSSYYSSEGDYLFAFNIGENEMIQVVEGDVHNDFSYSDPETWYFIKKEYFGGKYHLLTYTNYQIPTKKSENRILKQPYKLDKKDGVISLYTFDDGEIISEKIIFDPNESIVFKNATLTPDGEYAILEKKSTDNNYKNIDLNAFELYRFKDDATISFVADNSVKKQDNGTLRFESRHWRYPYIIDPKTWEIIPANKFSEYSFVSRDQKLYAQIIDRNGYYNFIEKREVSRDEYDEILERFVPLFEKSKVTNIDKEELKQIEDDFFDYLQENKFNRNGRAPLNLEDIVDQVNFLEVGISGTDTKIEVYSKNTSYLNYAAFSDDNCYLATVGKPSDGGHVNIYKLNFNEKKGTLELVGQVTFETGKAVWKCSFNYNSNIIGTYDSDTISYFYNADRYNDSDNKPYYALNQNPYSMLIGKDCANGKFTKIFNNSFECFAPSANLVSFSSKSYVVGEGHMLTSKYSIGSTSINDDDLVAVEIIEEFNDHGAPVKFTTFSNDNKKLLSVSDDGTVVLRNIEHLLTKCNALEYLIPEEEDEEWKNKITNTYFELFTEECISIDIRDNFQLFEIEKQRIMNKISENLKVDINYVVKIINNFYKIFQ